MDQITDILLSSIQSSELNSHSTDVVTMVQDANIEDPALTKFKEKLSAVNNNLTLALNQEKKSKFTGILETLDDKRDNNFRCLKGHAEADTFNEDGIISAAADRIVRILENHGLRLYALSYEKESSALHSLFIDLDTDVMQADLATLGLTDKYIALKNAQTTFSAAYLERSADASTKDTIIPAYLSRRSVKKSLKTVTDYINLMVNSGDASFVPLAKAIDDLTKIINQKIRTRLEAGRDKKEDGEQK